MQLEIAANPMANLVYHLDCLSGMAPDASREAIRELWIRQGWLGDADNQLITQWKALGERYRIQASFKAPGDEALGYPAEFAGVKVADQLRKAGWVAQDLESFRRLARVVMQPGDGEAACRILAAFQPRFFRWWSGKGPQWQAMVDRIAARLTKLENQGFFDKLSTFFAVPGQPPTSLFYYLMPVASAGPGSMHGKRLETSALLEVQENDGSGRPAEMLIHELCHQLADRWMQDRDHGIRKQMLAGGDPWGVSAYEFLDEAIATAIGNGLVPSLLSQQPATDWYLNTTIDRYAKSLLPVLQDSFKSHTPIHDPKLIASYTEPFRRLCIKASVS